MARLLLADAASDQLRMLFPVATDSFVAGPEVAKPDRFSSRYGAPVATGWLARASRPRTPRD